MIAITRYSVPEEQARAFEEEARALLDGLAGRPGYLIGSLARAADDAALWVMVTEWEGAGFYRRALSPYDIRIAAMRLMHMAINEPGAYEMVETVVKSLPPQGKDTTGPEEPGDT